INQLLNRLTTVRETPTNSGESTSQIQTRSSKAINALNQDSNESSSDQSDDSDKSSLKVSPIMTNSMTNSRRKKKLGFVSFNANNVYEWNIDGKTEYNIMSMFQHMTMVGITYQAAHEISEKAIANVNDQNKPIIGDDGEPIPDAVNTLIFTIARHFKGDPSLWKDRSAELLSNLRCKTLSDFRWYKDTFFTR
ncbi:hypothetical protein S245_017066, partial [Arachis hypogaea]